MSKTLRKERHLSVNAHVDAVFVLSVRSLHDRIAHIERELGRHGIAFEWVFEHDADELTPEIIDATFAASDMQRSQQSLVLKHVETWRRCVQRNYRRVLVFEDDAILAPQFAQTFDAALRDASSIDTAYMLYLGCGDNKYVQNAPRRAHDSVLVAASMPLPATDATVFDQRAARLRLQYIERRRITRPADWLMREADAAMGIAQYWLRDPIVEQGSMNGRFASVLDRKRIARGRAWSWLRFRWDRWRRRGAVRDEPLPIEVAPALQRRDRWALATARTAAAFVAIGAFAGAALANIAAGVMLLAFLLAPSCLQRVRRAVSQPLGAAVIVLLAVLLLSTLWSAAGLAAALKAWTGWRTFALLFIALAVFDARSTKLTFAATYIVAASAAAVASFFEFDFGAAQPLSDVENGIVMRNHVTQSMSLTVGALLSLALWLHVRSAWQRWACAAAAGLMLANVIFIAYGRSGYVALAITSTVAAFGLWRGRARSLAMASVVALMLGAFVSSPLIVQRFAKAWQEVTETSTSEVLTPMGVRPVMWQTAVTIVREAPVLGHGLGSFPEQYRRVVTQRYTGWRATLTHDPHNQYLLLLAEAGLLGLAAFAGFLWSALRQPVSGVFRVIGLAMLLAWCATSLFSSHFSAFNEGHLIAIMLGVCLAREVGARDQPARASAESTALRTSS